MMKKIIRLIAATLIAAFIAQDVAWAYPYEPAQLAQQKDKLAVASSFKDPAFQKTATTVYNHIDKIKLEKYRDSDIYIRAPIYQELLKVGIPLALFTALNTVKGEAADLNIAIFAVFLVLAGTSYLFSHLRSHQRNNEPVAGKILLLPAPLIVMVSGFSISILLATHPIMATLGSISIHLAVNFVVSCFRYCDIDLRYAAFPSNDRPAPDAVSARILELSKGRLRKNIAIDNLDDLIYDPGATNIKSALLALLEKGVFSALSRLGMYNRNSNGAKLEFLGEIVQANSLQNKIKYSRVLEMGPHIDGVEVDALLEVNRNRYNSPEETAKRYRLPGNGLYLMEGKVDESGDIDTFISYTIEEKIAGYLRAAKRLREDGKPVRGIVFAFGGEIARTNIDVFHKTLMETHDLDLDANIEAAGFDPDEFKVYTYLIPEAIYDKAPKVTLTQKEINYIDGLVLKLKGAGDIKAEEIEEFRALLERAIMLFGFEQVRTVKLPAIFRIRDIDIIMGKVKARSLADSVLKNLKRDIAKAARDTSLSMEPKCIDKENIAPSLFGRDVYRLGDPGPGGIKTDFVLGQDSWGSFEMFITKDLQQVYVAPKGSSEPKEYFVINMDMRAPNSLIYHNGDRQVVLDSTVAAALIGRRQKTDKALLQGIVREAIGFREELIKRDDLDYNWIDAVQGNGTAIYSYDALSGHRRPSLVELSESHPKVSDMYGTDRNNKLSLLVDFGRHTPKDLGSKFAISYLALTASKKDKSLPDGKIAAARELVLSVQLEDRKTKEDEFFAAHARSVAYRFLQALNNRVQGDSDIIVALPWIITVEDARANLRISFNIDLKRMSISAATDIDRFDDILKRSLGQVMFDSEEIITRRTGMVDISRISRSRLFKYGYTKVRNFAGNFVIAPIEGVFQRPLPNNWIMDLVFTSKRADIRLIFGKKVMIKTVRDKGRISFRGEWFGLGNYYVGEKVTLVPFYGLDWDTGFRVFYEGALLGIYDASVNNYTRVVVNRKTDHRGRFSSFHMQRYNLGTRYANEEVELKPRENNDWDTGFVVLYKGREIAYRLSGKNISIIEDNAPPVGINLLTRWVLPKFEARKFSARETAFWLGAIEELFFSGALITGLGWLAHLYLGMQLHSSFLLGFNLSVILFPLMHIRQVTRLKGNIFTHGPPSRKDLVDLYVLGFLSRAIFLLIPLSIPLTIFSVPVTSYLHGIYNARIAPTLGRALGMAALHDQLAPITLRSVEINDDKKHPCEASRFDVLYTSWKRVYRIVPDYDKTPVLTIGQEAALAREKDRGNSASWEAFIKLNLGLVYKMMRKSKIPVHIDESEVESAAMSALNRAAANFEWKRGYKFSTLACGYILRDIGKAIVNETRRLTYFGQIKAGEESLDGQTTDTFLSTAGQKVGDDGRPASEATFSGIVAAIFESKVGKDIDKLRKIISLYKFDPSVEKFIIERIGLIDCDNPGLFRDIFIRRLNGGVYEVVGKAVKLTKESVRQKENKIFQEFDKKGLLADIEDLCNSKARDVVIEGMTVEPRESVLYLARGSERFVVRVEMFVGDVNYRYRGAAVAEELKNPPFAQSARRLMPLVNAQDIISRAKALKDAGSKIRLIRERLGWSLADLARASEMSASAIHAIETDPSLAIKSISMKKLIGGLSAGLDIEEDALKEKAFSTGKQKTLDEVLEEAKNENISGKKIMILYRYLEWSRWELEKRSGVSDATISMIERGETNPKTETIIKIVSALAHGLGIDKDILGRDIFKFITYKTLDEILKEARARKTIGQKVKVLRRYLEWSQERLGERAGVSGVLIGLIEKGRTKSKPATINSIISALALGLRGKLHIRLSSAALTELFLMNPEEAAEISQAGPDIRSVIGTGFGGASGGIEEEARKRGILTVIREDSNAPEGNLRLLLRYIENKHPGLLEVIPKVERLKYIQYILAVGVDSVLRDTGELLSAGDERVLFRALEELKANKAKKISKSVLRDIDNRIREITDCIVRKNQGLVYSVYYRLAHIPGWNKERDDCGQDGNIGLLKAIDRFKYQKGYRFSTYAFCVVRRYMSRDMLKEVRAIHFTAKRDDGLPEGMDSIEDPHGRAEDITEGIDPRLLSILPYREAQVLRLRLAPNTLERIGKAFGVTKEMARQIETSAKKRIASLIDEHVILDDLSGPAEAAPFSIGKKIGVYAREAVPPFSIAKDLSPMAPSEIIDRAILEPSPGDRIKFIRRRLGLSWYELNQLSGVYAWDIWEIENGVKKKSLTVPQLKLINALVRLLKTDRFTVRRAIYPDIPDWDTIIAEARSKDNVKDRARVLREGLRWELRDLAYESGVKQGVVSDLESGKKVRISPITSRRIIAALAKGLGLEGEDIDKFVKDILSGTKNDNDVRKYINTSNDVTATLLAAIHALTKPIGTQAPLLPQGTRILLSETLFDKTDIRNLAGDRKETFGLLGKDSSIQIVSPKDIRNASINANASRETLACVISKEDYGNKELWNNNHKAQNKASMLILNEDLKRERYLYLEGVVGLSNAMIRKDKIAIGNYLKLLFITKENMAEEELIKMLIENPGEFAKIITFKPITRIEPEELLNRYKSMVENYLVMA